MNARLLIRIDTDGDLHWLALPEGVHGEGTPSAAARSAQREVLVLVPAEDVLLVTAELPRASPTKLAKVLPYALEDRVLDPVDALHFALGPKLDNGRHAVAVVARERLEAWLACLQAADIVADVVLPETLAVPFDAGATAVFLLEHHRLIVRSDAYSGFACTDEQLKTWWGLTDAPQRVTLYRADTDASSAEQIEQLLPTHSDVGVQAPAAPLTTFAAGAGNTPVLNLLQGEFAPHHRRAPQRRLWRLAAVLALLAVSLGLLDRLVDVVRLQAAHAELNAAIDDAYARAFPDSGVVPNPVARMHSELQRLNGGAIEGALLPMLGKIAPILVSQDSRMVTLAMEYRGGTLELAVRTVDVAGLDQLRERLATVPGMRVELTAATPGPEGVEGRLRIHGGGA